MRNRIAAAIGAIGLIAAAVLLRGALGDDSTGVTAGGSDAPIVGCAPGLEAICEALAAEGLIAPAPPTIALDVSDLGGTPEDDPVFSGRLEDGTRVDGWIALRPSAAIANDPNGEPTWAPGIDLAGAPIGVASKNAIVSCPETVDWACVSAGELHDIATGDPATVDGLLRLLPFRRALAADGDAGGHEVRDALRRIVDDRSQAPANVGPDRNIMITRPGAYRLLIAPTVGLTDHPRFQDGIVVVPPGSIEFTIALHPRAGSAGDGWTGRIAERARSTSAPTDEGDGEDDDRLAAALAALGVEPLDEDTTEPDAGAEADLAQELLELEGLVNP